MTSSADRSVNVVGFLEEEDRVCGLDIVGWSMDLRWCVSSVLIFLAVLVTDG